MRYATIRLHFPEGALVHVHRALVESERVRAAHLLSGGVAESDPAYLFYVEGSPDPVRAALDADGVDAYDVTSVDEGHFYVHVVTDRSAAEAVIRETFTRGTLVTTLPIVLRDDGSVQVTLVGAATEIRDAVDDVPLETTIERIGDYVGHRDPTADLTDRQREVVATAIDLGHYDRPRDATNEDVAAELDLAPSTVSTHLRAAEARLVKRAFES